MSDVGRKSLGRPVLYAIIVVAIYLSYLVLKPFFVALTWAVIFAILFRGMHVALARKMGPNRAAVVTTLVVTVGILGPGLVLISVLAREAPQVVDYLKQTSQDTPRQLQKMWDAARAWSPVPMPENPTDFLTTGAQRAVTFLAPRAGALVADFFATLGTLAAMLFALFFMLRDGDAMSRQLRDRLPFAEQESESLMSGTRDLVIASVGASLVVAAAQGLLGGVAFWLVGIRPALFWGVVTAFCSLLPVVGATIVWVPTAIWLLLSGEIGRGVTMLLAGALGISMVDNILRPVLLSGKTSVSGFVVFFGLLGGAAAFGFIGLVIGPIILVLTSRVLEDLHRPDLLDASVVPEDRIVGVSGE